MARLRKELGLLVIKPAIEQSFDDMSDQVISDMVFKLLLVKAVTVDELKEIAWYHFLQARVAVVGQLHDRLLESLHTLLPRVLTDLVLEYFV